MVWFGNSQMGSTPGLGELSEDDKQFISVEVNAVHTNLNMIAGAAFITFCIFSLIPPSGWR